MGEFRRIREMREDHDLTQRQIAEILNMPQQQYLRYEKGYRDFPLDVLIRLSNLFEVSVDFLLGLTDNPKRAE